MQAGPLHDLVKPLSWIIGTWKSVCALVTYPTMKAPVNYCETLSFVSVGQPILNYQSVTWHAQNKSPMHLESGFVRIADDKCSLTFIIAQNFGIATLEEGKVINNCITLSTSCIAHTKFARKEVVTLHRKYLLSEEGKLEYKLKMQTVDTPLCDHAHVIYEKSC